MSKYHETSFFDEKSTSSNVLEQDNILFSRNQIENKLDDKINSIENKMKSNKNFISLNSIVNPSHKEINQQLTEVELNNDVNLSTNNERLKAHENLIDLKKNSELTNMKRILVSLDTDSENNSNINRSYLFNTNTLTETNNQENFVDNSSRQNLDLINAVHLNHCSNNNFQDTTNVSFFGIRTNNLHQSNSNSTIFGNFGKMNKTAKINSFFRQIKFIWLRATLLERILSFFILLLLLTIFHLSFTVLTIRSINTQLEETINKSTYCVTPQCINVASAMLSAMDNNVSPCDDFYKYSCGGWINSNPLPQGKSIWGAFGKLWQENQLAMKNVLEENITYTSQAQTKAKVYYRSCLDKNETIEKIGAKPILEFIELINGWNITGKKFNAKNWSLADSIELLHCKYNRGGLFSWAVGADERNSSRHILQLDQAPLGLPSSAYYLVNGTDESILKAYEKYMIKVAQLLRKNEKMLNKTNETYSYEDKIFSLKNYDDEVDLVKYQSTLNLLDNLSKHEYTANIKDYEKSLLEEYEENKEIERQMKQVLQFEIELANIIVPLEERRDDERIYHKYTLSKLKELSPSVDWIHYFRYAFDPINYTITDNEPIIVYSPDYISEMSKLIQKYSSTDDGKVVLANYIVWTAVQSLTSYLSKPFRDASKILRKALVGSEGKESAWRYCVTDTNSVMGFALGAMFVDSVFKGEAKPIAQQMIEQIREAFKENLLSLDWMDINTRKLATEKADAITDMIGFPDFILDPDKLDEKYEGLNFSDIEYFENNIKVNIFSLQKNIEKIFRPANKSEWQMSPPTVNAYYTPTKNQIVFPAGILQTPFYDIHYPKSLNFGAMGVVMGHELTHAFDDQGREYDKFGNLHQWWKNETIKNFKERMQCFVKQYSKFEANGDHVNGKQTLGENIADNGGLKASYKAYEKWMAKNEPELALPGVNLTNHQLFFIGFAQVWCSVSTIESQKLQILNDPHSPAEFRVIGTLSNSKEFAKQYNCPLGSPMNPVDKCEVW